MGRALLVLDSQNVKDLAITWIHKAPVGTRVEFKASKRSLPQNDLMWALLTEVAQQYEHNGRKYDPASWKAIFLHAFGREVSFLPSLDMKTFLPIELSSSDLSKDEMTNFIEFILKEGTERGVVFKSSETSASPPQGEAGELEKVVAATSPVDPAGEPSISPAGSDEPDMFGKFEFAPDELLHLKDLARKALDDAASDADAPAKDAAIAKLFDGYADAIESAEGRQAMAAMSKPITAVIDGKRTRQQGADFIARDVLGVKPEELEGRK